MKIRTIIGLAAVGGLLYLHRKRGGEWSVESFQDSARQLWHGIQASAEKAKAEAKRELKDLQNTAKSTAQEMNPNPNPGLNGRIGR